MRAAARVLVKSGDAVLRYGAPAPGMTATDVDAHLVHPDGFLRVPVLVRGDLLVRGFTEALYREALDVTPPPAG